MAADASPTFDLAGLARAIEQRDAEAQLAAYAPDAELEIVDPSSPPASPRVLRGHDEIGPFLRDVCARDMTHAVERAVGSADAIAFSVHCRYPDGTQVRCACSADLGDAGIVRQSTVQVWDG